MRRFVVVFALVCLCILCMGAIYSLAFAATSGHGCAPQVPPGIPGTPAPAPAAAGVVVINEVLTAPHSTWNCSESGVYFENSDSWVEFYNTQNQPYNLYSAHAVLDSGPNTNAYYFPLNASIAAHGYLVVFPYLNSSFVATRTSTIRLLISNVVIDQVAVPALGPDQSYARTYDGAPTWIITSTPTIDASNTSLVTPTAGSAPLPGTVTSTQAVAFGTQPAWKKMLVPTTPPSPTPYLSPATSPATPATLNAPTTTASSGPGLPQRIILTLLIVALGWTLFLWWRKGGIGKKGLTPEQAGKERAQDNQQR